VLCEKTRKFRIVGHCGDGRSAIKLIASLSPDVAVLDLGLPKLYALAAIPRIRRRCPSTKILIVSMRRDRKTVLEVLRSGANGYVLKSDPAECLLEALRQIRREYLRLATVQPAGSISAPRGRTGCGVRATESQAASGIHAAGSGTHRQADRRTAGDQPEDRLCLPQPHDAQAGCAGLGGPGEVRHPQQADPRPLSRPIC